MSQFYVVTTKKIEGQWAEYFRRRPQEEPPDITAALEHVDPATSAEVDFTLYNDALAFTHPEFPGVLFLAKEQHGERLFIGMHVRNALPTGRKVQTRPADVSAADVRMFTQAGRDQELRAVVEFLERNRPTGTVAQLAAAYDRLLVRLQRAEHREWVRPPAAEASDFGKGILS